MVPKTYKERVINGQRSTYVRDLPHVLCFTANYVSVFYTVKKRTWKLIMQNIKTCLNHKKLTAIFLYSFFYIIISQPLLFLVVRKSAPNSRTTNRATIDFSGRAILRSGMYTCDTSMFITMTAFCDEVGRRIININNATSCQTYLTCVQIFINMYLDHFGQQYSICWPFPFLSIR